jgi:hypothetical protein
MSDAVPSFAPQPGPDNAGALSRFKAWVLADPALQAELAQPYDPAVFASLAVTRAAERGIALDAAIVRDAARPDPLGVSRWTVAAPLSDHWPERQWLPTDIAFAAEPFVDWAHYAGLPLDAPFFEESVQQVRHRPFNAVFKHRTSLETLMRGASAAPRPPDGLIFHMSRCGSTLVSQMLAAVTRHTVLSEAPAIRAAVQIESDAADRYRGLVAAMVSALGRRRSDDVGGLFVKLDAWHAMALPLFRRAFPDTPWVFLYRDPLEVMVSQIRVRGMHLVGGIVAPATFGIDPDGLSLDEYGARVLASICDAAAEGLALGGGLLVNYRELPDAVFTRILPHFGVAASAEDEAAMRAAAGRDAKAPYAAFKPDSESKRREATPALAAIVERCMAPSHARLEALRAASA